MLFHIFMYILKACVKVSGRETTKLPKGQWDGENNVTGLKRKACQKLWSLNAQRNMHYVKQLRSYLFTTHFQIRW